MARLACGLRFKNFLPLVRCVGGCVFVPVIGLVGLDDLALAAHRGRVGGLHGFADAMRHEPCRAVCDAKHPVRTAGAPSTPFLLAAMRWKPSAHLFSGIWLLSMTVPTVTVKGSRQALHWYMPGRCACPDQRRLVDHAAMRADRAVRPADRLEVRAGLFLV